MKILFLIILTFITIFPQPKKDFRPVNRPSFLHTETILLPSDSGNIIYYTYRIPLNKLVFEKNNSHYDAGYRIAIEVMDAKNNFVTRQINEKKISVKSFDETNSSELFSEGLVEFNLTAGNYSLIPIFTDLNSNRELRLAVEEIKPVTNGLWKPIVVRSEKSDCNGSEKYFLANYDGNIPFDIKEYNLLIPFSEQETESFITTVINNKDTVFSETVSLSEAPGLKLSMCEGKIAVITDQSSKIKLLELEKISSNLKEGSFSVYLEKSKKDKLSFHKNVKWFNKPVSLFNPEFAIKILINIEDEKTVNKMLDADSDNYSDVLMDYWKKFDPTPGTKFNELMLEFYERVDYSATNFSSIGGKSGVESDRGKIFIKFGKPKKVERSSNELGKVIETWFYEKIDKKFVFVDERGTGEFSLKNG